MQHIHFLSEFQKTNGKLEEKSILFYRNGLLQILGFIVSNFHLRCEYAFYLKENFQILKFSRF